MSLCQFMMYILCYFCCFLNNEVAQATISKKVKKKRIGMEMSKATGMTNTELVRNFNGECLVGNELLGGVVAAVNDCRENAG